jgi:hypothetical protein
MGKQKGKHKGQRANEVTEPPVQSTPVATEPPVQSTPVAAGSPDAPGRNRAMPYARRVLSLGTMPFIITVLIAGSFTGMAVKLFLQSNSVTILETTIHQLKTELNDSHAAALQLRQQLNESKADHSQLDIALHAENTVLIDAAHQLQQQLHESKADHSQLEANYTALQAENTVLIDAANQLQQQLNEFKADHSLLEANYTALQAENNRIVARAHQVAVRLQHVEGRIDWSIRLKGFREHGQAVLQQLAHDDTAVVNVYGQHEEITDAVFDSKGSCSEGANAFTSLMGDARAAHAFDGAQQVFRQSSALCFVAARNKTGRC